MWAITSGVNIDLPDIYYSTLVIDPTTPDTLYAGTTDGSVFKSTNGGESWSEAVMISRDILTLAIDPLTPTILYARTFDQGVFKSTDGGENWSDFNIGLPIGPTGPLVVSLAIDPLTPTTLYAGIHAGGVFKSTDGGENWSKLKTSFHYEYVSILAINLAEQTTLYALGTNNMEFYYYPEDSLGVFKSTDGGENWSEINTGLTHIYVYTLVVDPATQTTLYLGTTRGVFKGTNGGGN